MTTVQFIVCAVRLFPLTAGKQRAGVMTSHQAHAATLVGLDLSSAVYKLACVSDLECILGWAYHLPRFHGPGLNLPRLNNNFRATGAVKEVYCAMAPEYQSARCVHNEFSRRILTDTEYCADSNRSRKHQKAEQGGNCEYTPSRNYWSVCPFVYFTPPTTSRQRTITGIGKYHPGGGDRTALANKVLRELPHCQH